ncbi:Ubiquitin-like domain superfamily [Arabidopsis thaliana x Arabidopsis arenosa]|uniref:Ubiquitin-like domain superfamily n=1 Tax=Arabidopsis thaliana x Arabidopsis arenosa TaxID=1240361 RepID=A0A8T1XI76_9BRAS|nr:Ubiquitin-like domain superfamily [Arabidopsis thaliana x Arabidopsis arenosa]
MSNTQEDDKKPIDQEQEAHVILKDGDEVLFKNKKSTPLRKLMYVYCDRRGLNLDAFAFIFDKYEFRRIRGTETPDELDMEDGDVIYACHSQGGGLQADQRQWSYMVFDHNRL